MLPILFSIGPVKIYSYGVFLALGLFLSLYWWWKMGRDEHFEEIALFDGFFLAVITYWVAGRAGYVLMHLSEIGTFYRSLAILAYPGIDVVVGMVSTAIFVLLFARAKDWQVWKAADAFVVALSLVLTFGSIGAILNGTSPIWQVNVWGAVWAFTIFIIVSRVRKNFRFYSWYKGESSMAQEGLAGLIFVLGVGVYYLVVGFMDVQWHSILGLVLILVSAYSINKRVGRRENTLWGKLSNIIRRK